jgi:hypothetical protein
MQGGHKEMSSILADRWRPPIFLKISSDTPPIVRAYGGGSGSIDCHMGCSANSQRASEFLGSALHTDKKENQIFLIYKGIQSGAVAKPYMTNGLLVYMGKYLHISSYIRKPFLIYDFATAPL